MTDEAKYRAYERVRCSGRFNMITEADEAADKAGLSFDDYFYVIENYDALSKKYGA